MKKQTKGILLILFIALLFIAGYITYRIITNDPTLPREYVACGCGCCGGYPKDGEYKCLYHILGDNMRKIIEEDSNITPEMCALAGCSTGIRYKYCD